MPRHGSLTVSDVRGPTLAIRCEPCGRPGRFNGADAKLTDLLGVLVGDCAKARAVSVHDRCKATYENLIV